MNFVAYIFFNFKKYCELLKKIKTECMQNKATSFNTEENSDNFAIAVFILRTLDSDTRFLYVIVQIFARFGKISGRDWSSHGLYFGETVGRAKIPMARPNKP